MPHAVNYRQFTRCFGSAPLLAALLVAGSAVARAGDYSVRVDAGLSILGVSACFDAPAPDSLRASMPDAAKHLKRARVAGGEWRDRNGTGELPVPGTGDRSCVEYEVDARSAARAPRFARANRPGAGAVLLDPGGWLWLPDPAQAPVHRLRFELPDDMQASAPWPEDGGGGFRVDGSMLENASALVAIGRLAVERIVLPGTELRFAVLPGSPPADHAMVRDWVRHGAQAITTVYGSFPVPSPQVLVVPIGRGSEPVPWGQVLRGGGAAAHLFIDQTRPAAEFADDWVLVHELSHLLHPDLGQDSAWLAEGLATYYQYVARVRAGMMTERQAWQKLHEGFERGRGQTRSGVDLLAATRSMREQRIFMRVYWTGTAVALLADLALRDSGSSLDAVLGQFRDCCLAEARAWKTGEFLERLDRISGTGILSGLARRYLHSDRFPDLREAYERLGLLYVDGRIELASDGAAAGLRRAIMESRI